MINSMLAIKGALLIDMMNLLDFSAKPRTSFLIAEAERSNKLEIHYRLSTVFSKKNVSAISRSDWHVYRSRKFKEDSFLSTKLELYKQINLLLNEQVVPIFTLTESKNLHPCSLPLINVRKPH